MEEREFLKDLHIYLPIGIIQKTKDLVENRQFDNQSEAIRYLLNAGIELWEKRNLCKDEEFVNSIIPKEDVEPAKEFVKPTVEDFDKLPIDMQRIISIISRIETKDGRERVNKILNQL